MEKLTSTVHLVVFGGLALLAAGCTNPPPEGDACGGDADQCPPADTAPTDGDAASLAPWGDADGDQIPNREDNCPRVSNTPQADADGDGVGDACDNCPKVANREQTDTDPSTQRGDACDEVHEYYRADRDGDGDGLPNIDDNCPETANQKQADADGDDIGDACDNCPMVPNPVQRNTTQAGPGDACSPEPVGSVCRRLQSDFNQFTPNIYFLLDKSGSMKSGKLNTAQSAIVTVAQKLQNRARFGSTAFSTNCAPPELLEMGQHNAAAVQNSLSRVVATGETGTGGALATIRMETRFVGPDESTSNKRPKAVLVVTDGKANVCGGQSKARSEAKKLRNQYGVKTHVVGFKSESSPSNLRDIAKAGGTSDFISASNETDLERAATRIFEKSIPCSFELPEPDAGIDPNRIWVEIDGSFQHPSSFSYNESTKVLTLDNSTCNKLRNASTDSSVGDPIEIVMGCPVECSSSDEVCDYVDNDCDGEVDEGCRDCGPEQCNGSDDDCDGETDEGCPDCRATGDTCTRDGQCCSRTCQAGLCKEPCHPTGSACQSDGDCCSGLCATPGDSSAQSCVGQ